MPRQGADRLGHNRTAVEGYESERQKRARERRENEAAKAQAREIAADAKKMIPQTLAELRGTAPDCVIEIPYRPLLGSTGSEKRRKGKPAWYLGEISPEIDPGDYVPASTHYALDERGKLYRNNNGVGERKQFVCRPSKPVPPPADAEYVALLRRVRRKSD